MNIEVYTPEAYMGDIMGNLNGRRGAFLMEFSHYEEVPSHLQQKIVQEAVKEGRVKPEEE